MRNEINRRMSFLLAFLLLAIPMGLARAELKKGAAFFPLSLKSVNDETWTIFMDKDRLTVKTESVINGDKKIKISHPDAVLLDFWATWCVPCRAAIPHLEKLYEKYRPETCKTEGGLEIVGVSLDQSGMKIVKPFVKKLPITYAMLADSPDAASDPEILRRTEEIQKKYGVVGLPVSCLIDAKGIVQTVHVGFNMELLGEIEAEIKKLVGEKK